MDIKQDLEDLIVLQDNITHLNAKGMEDSEEALALLEKRNRLWARIVDDVDTLFRALKFVAVLVTEREKLRKEIKEMLK